jgi:DNA-binding Lrp family transcriptional regulator
LSTAFVLITSETGRETEIEDKIKEMEYVKEVYLVYGQYDIIVRITAENQAEIKSVVFSKIRNLKGIRSTLTLAVVE